VGDTPTPPARGAKRCARGLARLALACGGITLVGNTPNAWSFVSIRSRQSRSG